MGKKMVRDNSRDKSKLSDDKSGKLGTSFEKGAKVKNGSDVVSKRKSNDKLSGY